MSTLMQFAVIGNPIAHSRSPQIHAAFAEAIGRSLRYERILAEADSFETTVVEFFADGGVGMNVTVPFKEQAFRMVGTLSARARAAGAVNTLGLDDDGLFGDNTDGIGLVRDITGRLGFSLAGRRVLLLGAGGAARGVIGPLLDAGVADLAIANRTASRAAALVDELRGVLAADAGARLHALVGKAGTSQGTNEGTDQRWHGDVLINATSAGLGDAAPELPSGALEGLGLAYEMVYGAQPTPFMGQARDAGCPMVSDGLGMLVEQAAAAFALWHGVQPPTAPVYAQLRAAIDGSAPAAGLRDPARSKD